MARTVSQRIEKVNELPKYKGKITNKLAIHATATIESEPVTRPKNSPLLLLVFLKSIDAGTTNAIPTIRLASSPIPAVRVMIKAFNRF